MKEKTSRPAVKPPASPKSTTPDHRYPQHPAATPQTNPKSTTPDHRYPQHPSARPQTNPKSTTPDHRYPQHPSARPQTNPKSTASDHHYPQHPTARPPAHPKTTAPAPHTQHPTSRPPAHPKPPAPAPHPQHPAARPLAHPKKTAPGAHPQHPAARPPAHPKTAAPGAHSQHPSARPQTNPKSTAPDRPYPPQPAAVMPPAAAGGVFAALIPELRRAVAEEGYTVPTPIQEQAIPHLVAGRDLIGCAQTGTGKTAAFSLPILQYLTKRRQPRTPGQPRVLVVAPTRELAAQIGASLATYGRHLRLSHAVIFGGVGQNPQVTALQRGLDILVATPGRLLDLMQQGHASLAAVEVFVLDEADRMLDMGFLPDIKRIIARLPQQRQSLFFSATMGADVVQLARTLVHDAVHVTVAHEAPAVERIEQRVLFVDRNDKDDLLISLLADARWQRVIVFTQMKHMANKVVKKLTEAGISAAAIHGNKSQGARTEALAQFKQGRVRVLVATDIAARGLDIDDISHVINYDMPVEPETYIHRIGRTARAGAGGDAVSFCSAAERDALRDIEKLIRLEVPVDSGHRYHSENARRASGASARPAPKQPRGRTERQRPAAGKPVAWKFAGARRRGR